MPRNHSTLRNRNMNSLDPASMAFVWMCLCWLGLGITLLILIAECWSNLAGKILSAAAKPSAHVLPGPEPISNHGSRFMAEHHDSLRAVSNIARSSLILS